MPEMRRFWIPDWVVDYMLSSLPANDTKVLLVMARHANRQGDSWPAVNLIARKAGVSRHTAQRALQRICRLGLILRRTGKKGGRGHSVVYQMFAQAYLGYEGRGKSATRGTVSEAERVPPVAPFRVPQKGAKSRQKGCQIETERVPPVAPEGIQEGIPEGGVAGALFRKVPGKKNPNEIRKEALRQVNELQKKVQEGILG